MWIDCQATLKKGYITECGNWYGIMLLPVPAKVIGRVIIARLHDTVDEMLREKQAGFRCGHSTTEYIFMLCNVIK